MLREAHKGRHCSCGLWLWNFHLLNKIMAPKSPILPKLPLSSSSSSSFHEKLLFLDSLGIDLSSSAAAHPTLAAAPFPTLRAAVALLLSLGLSAADVRRAAGMCPELLAASPSSLSLTLSFLLREARVPAADLPRVLRRRPRLLVSSVSQRLRPTLYFLQTLGVSPIAPHAPLLSCSVEDKFLPRLEFLEKAGLQPREARAMARRFPQLFCYSIEKNLEPKVAFLIREMRRGLNELKEFPQYLSFSLDERIRPRHLACEEKGVRLSLPALLRPSDPRFRARLEVCVGSSPPARSSPLWHESVVGC
ncbi:protein SEEDLING LETHAL 1, chloroplastic [Typha latifolia]|uniref:protein SEEDLING LETHAL 1, chloroplastic n=1 Tax=Typha latifolia TaxID=4733 RepID=UPI003C2D7D0A